MSRAKLIENRAADAVAILQNVIVPEPQHAKPLRLQPIRTYLIFVDLVRMLATIDLHDQSMREADEIDGVRTERLLPTELESGKFTVSQHAPNRALRIGGIAS